MQKPVVYFLLSLAGVAGITLSGCSRSSVFDDWDRAKKFSTINDLESWLGEPATIQTLHELQERELPEGAKFFDSEGESLGHGKYSIAVETDREIREYDHPEAVGVRFVVFTKDGKIDDIFLKLPDNRD